MTRERIAAPTPCALGELMNGSRPTTACSWCCPAGRPRRRRCGSTSPSTRNLLAEIDEAAAEAGTTRSGFLAEAARRVMNR